MGLDAAHEILKKYPVNSYAPVRYNPNDPAESALMSHPEHPDILLMAGYLFTGFGVLVCCFTSAMAFIVLGGIR